MRNTVIFIAALLAACPVLVHAEIYKRVLPDGSVVYTDEPHPDAEKITPPPIQVIQPPRPPGQAAPAPRQRPGEAAGYSAVRITSPADDEVIWNNEGGITVQVAVTPELQVEQGHRLVLIMDGKRLAGPSAGTTFALEEVFRGSHVLKAEVHNSTGDTLAVSQPITFHMKQQSILFRQSPSRSGGGLP